MRPRMILAALLVGIVIPLAAATESRGRAAPAAGTSAAQAAATQKGEMEYGVVQTLPIAGPGRWDAWSATPVTIDGDGKLLFVARERQTQVIEAASGKVIAEINSGPRAEPRSIALVPKAGRGFISNRTDNSVTVFDLKTYQVLGKIAVNGAPGAVVYDPMSNRVLVGCKIPTSLVVFPPDIDLKAGKTREIDLAGAPTGMIADGQGMVYVNIYDRDEVAVIDTREMRQVTTWPLKEWYRPMGIAMDRERNRLFIGCRSRVVVLSAVDGHQMGDVVVAGGDSWVGRGAVRFYDGKVFASCGEGKLVVVGQSATGQFEVQQRVQVPRNTWSLAVDARTQTLYMPAAQANAAGRQHNEAGIKLLVVREK